MGYICFIVYLLIRPSGLLFDGMHIDYKLWLVLGDTEASIIFSLLTPNRHSQSTTIFRTQAKVVQWKKICNVNKRVKVHAQEGGVLEGGITVNAHSCQNSSSLGRHCIVEPHACNFLDCFFCDLFLRWRIHLTPKNCCYSSTMSLIEEYEEGEYESAPKRLKTMDVEEGEDSDTASAGLLGDEEDATGTPGENRARWSTKKYGSGRKVGVDIALLIA